MATYRHQEVPSFDEEPLYVQYFVQSIIHFLQN